MRNQRVASAHEFTTQNRQLIEMLAVEDNDLRRLAAKSLSILLMNYFTDDGGRHCLNSSKCTASPSSSLDGLLQLIISADWCLNWKQKESFSMLTDFTVQHARECGIGYHLIVDFVNALIFITSDCIDDFEGNLLHICLYSLLGVTKHTLHDASLMSLMDELMQRLVNSHPDWTVRLVAMEIIQSRLKKSKSLLQSIRSVVNDASETIEIKLLARSILSSHSTPQQPFKEFIRHPQLMQIYLMDSRLISEFIGEREEKEAVDELNALFERTEEELGFPISTAQAIVLVRDQIHLSTFNK